MDVSTGDAQRRGVTQPCALCSPLAQLWDHLDHTMFFPDFRPFLSSGSLDQDGRDNERGHQAHAELWGPSRPPRLPMARRYRSRGSSRPDRSPAIEGYVSPTPGGGPGRGVVPWALRALPVWPWRGGRGGQGDGAPHPPAARPPVDGRTDGWMDGWRCDGCGGWVGSLPPPPSSSSAQPFLLPSPESSSRSSRGSSPTRPFPAHSTRSHGEWRHCLPSAGTHTPVSTSKHQ